jgi:hypothetical protein
MAPQAQMAVVEVDPVEVAARLAPAAPEQMDCRPAAAGWQLP